MKATKLRKPKGKAKARPRSRSVSVEDVLAKAEVKVAKGAPRKKGVIMELSTKEERLVERIVEFRRLAESYKTKADAKEALLLKRVWGKAKDYWSCNGFVNMVVCNDIAVVFQRKFAKVTVELRKRLKRMVGVKHFRRMFKKCVVVKVKEEIACTTKGMKRLIELVGEDEFHELFVVERWYEPTDEYMERYGVFDEATVTELDRLVKPHKPSVRTK